MARDPINTAGKDDLFLLRLSCEIARDSALLALPFAQGGVADDLRKNIAALDVIILRTMPAQGNA